MTGQKDGVPDLEQAPLGRCPTCGALAYVAGDGLTRHYQPADQVPGVTAAADAWALGRGERRFAYVSARVDLSTGELIDVRVRE